MTAALAVLAGRRAAEALMVDAVVIRRATGETVQNETTGREEPAAAATVWTGPCRVQRRPIAEQTPEAGERTVTVQAVEVHVPVTAAGIKVGDVAEITAAVMDTELTGRRFRVTGLAHKTYATARRLRCEEITG